jgi:RNA polymerase sigma-70 factor, ECF subfamily
VANPDQYQSPTHFYLQRRYLAPLPADAVEQQDQQRLLQDAIQALPPRFRTIVSLRYREELTFREIGQRLHIPENTAKTYFQRARPLLRAALASCWEEQRETE